MSNGAQFVSRALITVLGRVPTDHERRKLVCGEEVSVGRRLDYEAYVHLEAEEVRQELSFALVENGQTFWSIAVCSVESDFGPAGTFFMIVYEPANPAVVAFLRQQGIDYKAGHSLSFEKGIALLEALRHVQS